MGERPDGSTATAIGWVLVAIGIIAAFFVTSSESPSGFWFSIAISNLGVGLGVLLLSLGYLVRAIGFLPGREVSARRPSIAVLPAKTFEDGVCEWCNTTVHAPARPCSAFTEAQLPIAADRIKSKVCKSELDARGHLT